MSQHNCISDIESKMIKSGSNLFDAVQVLVFGAVVQTRFAGSVLVSNGIGL